MKLSKLDQKLALVEKHIKELRERIKQLNELKAFYKAYYGQPQVQEVP